MSGRYNVRSQAYGERRSMYRSTKMRLHVNFRPALVVLELSSASQLERSHQPNFFFWVLQFLALIAPVRAHPFPPRLHSRPIFFSLLLHESLQLSRLDLRLSLAPNLHIDSHYTLHRDEPTPRRKRCLPRSRLRRRRSIWVDQGTV